MFSSLSIEDFEVSEPIRIHSQLLPDECTASALTAIAEDVIGKPLDDNYTFSFINDSDFGVVPSKAVESVLINGFKDFDGNIYHPFESYKGKWNLSFIGISFFDCLRKTMWEEKKSLFCGCYWQDWSNPICEWPKEPLNLFPHAFKVFGQKTINGVIYLMIQDSRGENKGDKGIWYMPEETVNKFKFAYKFNEKK